MQKGAYMGRSWHEIGSQEGRSPERHVTRRALKFSQTTWALEAAPGHAGEDARSRPCRVCVASLIRFADS